jgi:hypothetical protein
VLIVGGGCRGRRLAAELLAAGDAVRITTRTPERRGLIESAGAECWVGTPDRLETIRGALDGVTIACWMLAQARGEAEQVRGLHGSRLRFFWHQVIDTTVRGVLYDASWGGAAEVSRRAVAPELLDAGARLTRELTAHNAIPARVLACEHADDALWIAAARGAVEELLGAGA